MILPDVYSYLIAHNTRFRVLRTYTCKNKTDSWKWIEAIILSEYINLEVTNSKRHLTGLDSDQDNNGINGNCHREENCFKTIYILLSTTFSRCLSSIKHARERHLDIPVLCTVGDCFKRSFSKCVRYKSVLVVQGLMSHQEEKRKWIIQICVSTAAVRQEH